MNLTTQLLNSIAAPHLTFDERAQLRCKLSKLLEESGDFEGARTAMGELWQRVGDRPALDRLTPITAAEVLWRSGVLTGCIGSAKQIEGAQETAKNLIYESITLFEGLQEQLKGIEAQTDLAVCYWRQGAFDEARVTLREAFSKLSDSDIELKALVLLRSAMVEKVATRLHDALHVHMKAAPLFEASANNVLKGKFHNEFGTVLKNLGIAEHRQDYIDRALIEYAAASFHFEQAGHERYCARVENNLGFLFSTIGKFSEAHEHVGRARRIFVRLKDSGSVAQVDDTRARVLLAEGRCDEAEKIVRSAVHTLEKGGEQSLLAEALTTHGVALARTGKYERASLTLQHAVLVAEQAGDLESAGQAALALIEEMCEQAPPAELGAVYQRAAELLAQSQHPAVPSRLASCAVRVIRLLADRPPHPAPPLPARPEDFSAPLDWHDFSFRSEIRRYERFLIERALKDARGIVTRASQLLGFKHYQSLITLLNKRHKTLMHARSPIFPRKRSIFRSRHPAAHVDKRKRPVRILHVEDNRNFADAVKEMMELEGWRVETCTDGSTALRRIAGHEHYDLLLLDNELPGTSGLELARRARKIPHRRRTPVIMLSAGDCETEAWSAGVDAFLRKPDEVLSVTETIARLIDIKMPHP